MKKHKTTLWHQVIAGKFNIESVKCYTGENTILALPAVTGPQGAAHSQSCENTGSVQNLNRKLRCQLWKK